MSTAFREFIEAVRSRIDIVDLIGADVVLRPSGSTLKGLSPFHPEKHPSFVVWPRAQSWHDFSNGGGLGGDVFAYVQQRDGLGFKEAVFALAEQAGIQRPDHDADAFRQELAALVERREIERLLTMAASHYHHVLPGEIRDSLYRQHYGFTDETIDKLQLGWADGQLLAYFTAHKVSREQALKTGLFVVLPGGRVEEFFKNRLVFPYWKRGQVVYFIARATEHTGDEVWEQAKYKKLLTHSDKHPHVSPAVRNDSFYNEDAACGVEELLITEGVTDCISAMQAGIACISPATTRFRTQDHGKLLALTERARRIVICNDSETSGAGEAGARETASLLWAAGRDVRVAVISRPAGKDKIDVNELVVTEGPGALKQVLAEARSYPEYLLDGIPKDTPRSELDRALAPVLELLAQARPIDRELGLDAIVKRFGIGKRTLAQTLKQIDLRHHAATSPPRPSPDDKPSIQVNHRQPVEILQDMQAVLLACNQRRIAARDTSNYPPLLFRRGDRLVGLKMRDDGQPELAQCSEPGIYGALIRYAHWVHINTRGEATASSPPKDVYRDILTYVPHDLPRLDSVIATPVFGKTGNLAASPGLHGDDGLWLELDPALRLPAVPSAPTHTEVARARSLFLDDLLVDFKFVTEADRAHMLAMVLLPFVRRLIKRSTPLHLIEAPAIGSGKGLLCHLASIVATGSECHISTLPGDEEEVRKTITAELLKAGTFIVLDNAKERKMLDSQALASALTAPKWTNRILGRTEMVEVPNFAVWVLTGNNVRLSEELMRRTIRIRIDSGVERAWQRTGFKHDPIEDWATVHRSELVHAALVLVQAWIAAGRPMGKQTLGSFTSWAQVMGGLLEIIEVPGFLGNLNTMYAVTEQEITMWREFVAAWWNAFQGEPTRVSTLNDFCGRHGLLEPVRREGSERAQVTRLGAALHGMRDRIFGGLRLRLVSADSHKGRCYALEQSECPTDVDDPQGMREPIADPSEILHDADETVALDSDPGFTPDPWED